jgi:tetratricopeptide (TPR) repeat protein
MIALPLLIVTQMSRGAGAPAVSQGTDFVSRILVAFHAMGFYIAKVFWPFGLIHYYGLDPKTVLATKAYLPYSAIFFAFIIFILLFKQYRKVLLGSTLVFFICLFPYLGFIAYDGQQQSTVSNRYVYFAMIGFSFAIAYLFVFLQNSRYSQLKYISLIPLIAMCILSESQCRYWENTKTLCEHTLSLDPHNKQAYFSLAIDAEAKKDKLKAIHYYELGIKMVPESEKSSRKRIAELRYEEDLISGAKLASQGNYEAASKLFEKVLSFEPDNYTALVNLGNIAAINRDLASAINFFARAIESEPAIVTAYLNIGKAYIFNREAKLAREAFKKVLEIEPDNANAQEQLHHLSMIQE